MSTYRQQPGDVTREYTEEARMKLGTAGRQVEQQAQQAQYRAEDLRERAASGLHSAAQALRHQGGERGQANLASRVAEPMDRSAQYLDTHSLTQIRSDLSEQAREHPLWAAAGVFTAAFLVGRLLRRR